MEKVTSANIDKIVNLICEDMETSAPGFINSLPVYIRSQANNIPENEIEDFAIGTSDKQAEIAELYNAVELHKALNDFFC